MIDDQGEILFIIHVFCGEVGEGGGEGQEGNLEILLNRNYVYY